MLVAALFAVAVAASPTHAVTLAGGVTQVAGSGAVGGGLTGRAIAHVGRIGVEAGAREGYLAVTERVLGSVAAGIRYTPSRGPHARIAFLHHHETPRDLAEVYPVQTMLGSLSGIAHRSGVEVGVGTDIPVLQRGYDGRLGVGLELAVGAFPDPAGSSVYVFLEQSFTIDLGRRRDAS